MLAGVDDFGRRIYEEQMVTRWGVVATGGIAARFTEDVQAMDDAQVVAVASRNEASAKTFADRFGIPHAYGDWAGLFADPEVDVVYVATPHSAHRVVAGAALEAGKPVLCEKPFTLNTREAEELVELALERDLFLMEGMWTYCSPVVRRLVELVRDGAIGELRSVQADFGLSGSFAPEHRLRNPELGGGAVLDLGVYPVAFAQLLLGEPDRIQADAQLSPEGVDVNTGMLLGWENGALATATCGLEGVSGTRATVTGSRGRIEVAHFFAPDSFVLHRTGADEPEVVRPESPLHGMQHEAAEVAACLAAGRRESSLVPLSGTLAVLRTLDRVRELIGVRYAQDTPAAN
jgi:predicted dehydrogenase